MSPFVYVFSFDRMHVNTGIMAGLQIMYLNYLNVLTHTL